MRALFCLAVTSVLLASTEETSHCSNIIVNADLPTVYEHYTQGGITSGLEPLPEGFRLNNKTITILSGSIHYFRVHPDYWRDRLRKLRALGANTVETYVPWNLHEPSPGKFDFGDGQDDLSPFLDIVKFIQTAKEEDLLVILRPGPFIDAEWEFGGMPSWLLRQPEMKLRTSDPKFENRVDIYFSALLPLVVKLQFTMGGPIIAFQIENEYGNVKEDGKPLDHQYLIDLHQLMMRLGLKEMFFTSDTPTSGEAGFVPSVLRTANFNKNPELQLSTLKQQQPDRPLLVTEYWTGWYDHWLDAAHHSTSVDVYCDVLERILKFPASVNMYMFHGGTNWGFMNGGDVDHTNFPFFGATVASYDYDAPLSEAGDYTVKYLATQQLFDKYNPVKTKLPAMPDQSLKIAYPDTPITAQLTYEDIIARVSASDRLASPEVVNMEMAGVNEGAGQSYGYIIYRKRNLPLAVSSVLKITGKVHDIATVLVDGVTKTEPLSDLKQLNGFGYWIKSDAELELGTSSGDHRTLDIMVENWGRNAYGLLSDFNEKKGLWEGRVLVDGQPIIDWEIILLQFKGAWVRSLTGWSEVKPSNSPCLYEAQLNVTVPQDTFLDMRAWGKGVVFVNGFSLGRYFNMGPLRTLYLPAPLLRKGLNQILVFEQFKAARDIVFSSTPIPGNVTTSNNVY